MTFYLCFGLTGIDFRVSYDYIRFSFLIFTICAFPYNLERSVYSMQMAQSALLAKTIILESLIKEKLPEDYKKIYTENIYDPIVDLTKKN